MCFEIIKAVRRCPKGLSCWPACQIETLLGLPGFHWPDRDRLRRHERDVAAATGTSVLGDGQWMEIDDARGQLAIFGRWRRCILVASLAWQRVVEGPVLDISLPALHHRAAHPGVPAATAVGRVGPGEVQ